MFKNDLCCKLQNKNKWSCQYLKQWLEDIFFNSIHNHRNVKLHMTTDENVVMGNYPHRSSKNKTQSHIYTTSLNIIKTSCTYIFIYSFQLSIITCGKQFGSLERLGYALETTLLANRNIKLSTSSWSENSSIPLPGSRNGR